MAQGLCALRLVRKKTNSFDNIYIQRLRRLRRPSSRVVDLYSVGAITVPAHNKAATGSGAGSVYKAKPFELLRSLYATGGEENKRSETSSPKEAGCAFAPHSWVSPFTQVISRKIASLVLVPFCWNNPDPVRIRLRYWHIYTHNVSKTR